MLEIEHDGLPAGLFDVVDVAGIAHDAHDGVATFGEAPSQPQGDLSVAAGDDNLHSIPFSPESVLRVSPDSVLRVCSANPPSLRRDE
ncbi:MULTISPECIES: hypothetical protein [unclassified Kitasatospora]|uniref:hypothetical protein n=1 Tax=unclassified Kitasatospora TaxID=2633591 RepID=UPI0033F23AAA